MGVIVTFCIVSILVGIVALKKPSIFFVVLVSSFFPYYFSIELLGMKLPEGGTLYIHVSFSSILLIYLFLIRKLKFTINNLDKFYILYYLLWLIVFLINLDPSLFIFKPYLQAPYWLTLTFILPIILKLIYNRTNISDFIRYLEWLGYFAASAIVICLLLGVTSKETGVGYEITDLSEAYRYAPFRGFFSLRQAGLLSVSIIIFFSKFMSSKLSKKEIIVKLPFVTLCLFGIIISGTRGTFIILSLLCCYTVITTGKFSKKITAVTTAAIIGIILLHVYYMPAYSHLFSRIFKYSSYTSEVGGINTRYEHYETGVRNFIKRPLIGNGMSKLCYDYDYSHSIIISILEDTGLLGFSILWLMGIFIFQRCRWRYKKELFTDNQFVIRNMIILYFLNSNLYGTVATCYILFLLIYMYYFIYRRRAQPSTTYVRSSPKIKFSLGRA